MLLAIIGVTAILGIIAYYRNNKSVENPFSVLAIVFAVVCGLALVFMVPSLQNMGVMDQQVAIYEEENARIERYMEMHVRQFLDYESETFQALRLEPADFVILAQTYPTLTGGDLVEQQIRTYIANRRQITDLRVRQTRAPILRWWIYFGR